MNKTFIIIQREFLSRVKKKTFLLSTILLPLLIFGLYGLIIYFSVKGEDNVRVAVVDSKGILEGKIQSDESLSFTFLKQANTEQLEKDLQDKTYSGYIVLPDSISQRDSIPYYTRNNVGLMTQGKITTRINRALEKNKLEALLAPGVTLEQIDKNKSAVELKVSKAGEQKSGNAGFATALGFVSGFLIYIVLFIYGTMVMRGVMEEKTNRIAEVMVSSVKPYQLMIGKIVGIGAVGLVQFLIWGVLMIALQSLLPLFFPELLEQAGSAQAAVNQAGGGKASMVQSILANMESVNMMKIIFLFIIYFLGGYLLYSSLFAAVGSAVNEDPQDAQQLMLPITMPIIFAFVIMMQAINNPDSPLAVFGSHFPLTSPIVMMARIPYGVPTWELFVSIGLLIGGFLGTTWLAAKIYRTGILMYGKKVTWKELWKWGMTKG